MTEHHIFLKSHNPKNKLSIDPLSTEVVILSPDTEEFKAKLKWRDQEFAHLCVDVCDQFLKVENHHNHLIASVMTIPLNTLNNFSLKAKLSLPMDDSFELPIILVSEKREEWKAKFDVVA